MLLEHGASPFCRDFCGRTPVDFLAARDQSPFHHLIPTFKNMILTSRVDQVLQTRKSIQHILCRLGESKSDIPTFLYQLYISTRHLEDFEAAEMILLQKGRYENKIQKFNFYATCDQCSSSLYDVMHACKICLETDLCGECMPKYVNENPLDWCIGHEFLEIKARSPYTDKEYDSAANLRKLIEHVRTNCLEDSPSQSEG